MCEVDTILFSLLILRGLCDSQGRVWRCHPNQFYAVEVTKPKRDLDHAAQSEVDYFPESRTLALLNLLPSVTCLSPRDILMQPEQNGEACTCMADSNIHAIL